MHTYVVEELQNQQYKKIKNFEIFYDFIEQPFGRLLVGLHDGKLCYMAHSIYSNEDELEKVTKTFPKSTLTHRQIENLPQDPTLLLKGTEFEISVWKQLLEIPSGGLVSYEDVAIGINKPKSTRAAANAIGNNPICFIVPCHRVIRKDGTIGGYGFGIEKKLAVLKYEGVDVSRFEKKNSKG